MTALTDLSDVVNLMTGGNSGAPENLFYYKDARVAGAVAATPVGLRWTSLWQYEGIPSHGAAPTTVAVPDNTTAGGLKQTNPAGVKQKWLMGVTASGAQSGTLVLYDRLLHIGNLSGTVTTAQTVGGSLTRYTGGAGNQIWAEIYTQIGATGTTLTASYTNQAGTSGQTTTAVNWGNTGFREAQRMIPLQLASGDTGVQAVASVTAVASTLTAGAFGVTVVHPLAIIPIINGGAGAMRDFITGLPGPIEILPNACLAWAYWPSTTTALTIVGSVHMCEK